MATTCLLSDQSKHYLCCYYQILDEMIQRITTAKLTKGVSHNCIVQMVPHHQAAIRMCRNILGVSDDTPTRRLAQAIADQRAQYIDQMEAQLPICGQDTAPLMDLRLYQRRTDLICREMFVKMGAVPESNHLNAIFLRQMIPHHQGLVHMSQNALRYGVRLELEPTLREIVRAQCRQIGQMRSLLRRMGCQAGGACTSSPFLL